MSGINGFVVHGNLTGNVQSVINGAPTGPPNITFFIRGLSSTQRSSLGFLAGLSERWIQVAAIVVHGVLYMYSSDGIQRFDDPEVVQNSIRLSAERYEGRTERTIEEIDKWLASPGVRMQFAPEGFRVGCNNSFHFVQCLAGFLGTPLPSALARYGGSSSSSTWLGYLDLFS